LRRRAISFSLLAFQTLIVLKAPSAKQSLHAKRKKFRGDHALFCRTRSAFKHLKTFAEDSVPKN